MRRPLVVMVVAVVVLFLCGVAPVTRVPVQAHSGGLDSTGGHHCREAGYNSGKCAPLNSYHCHRAPCGQAAPTTTEQPTTTRPPQTTTAPPPPTTTTTAPPTTVPPTSTTTEPPTTTTTEPPTTTSSVVPAGSSRDDDGGDDLGAGGAVALLVVLGALGYGGYWGLRRARAAG